jgi:hypothetical protein
MVAGRSILLDDRLLVRELLDGPVSRRPRRLLTTSYWYYRACRAVIHGAGGRLSGPFDGVDEDGQASAIVSLLELRSDIALPDPRLTVPAMARLSLRHPKLNLLNLEAAAAAIIEKATVLLSPDAARGILPPVLDGEGIRWEQVDP